MELFLYEGKDEEKVLNKALEDLSLTKDEILYKKETKKGGLFKSTTYKYTIVKMEEITEYVKTVLEDILTGMNLNVKYETSIRNKQINIKMFSDNNAILIGKNGQTLSALTLLTKQAVFNQVGVFPYINLDVENYKDKQIMHLERLARNIAKEVRETKTPVTMENMNSYERRIVHNALNDFKGIKTESEGEEPNRCVVVKPKND
ncbi:MAG TPA: KH domain-containing protein [Mollicutes bacterium]|nr:KH domain-containing protein [Mollicutes bacterium]